MRLSRWGLLKDAGTLLVGATVGGLSLSVTKGLARAGAGKQKVMDVPWPYKKLDTEGVAENAYSRSCHDKEGSLENT